MQKRIISSEEAATYLNMCAEQFRLKRKLPGFPKPLSHLKRGCYDIKALDAYLDEQSGLDAKKKIDWDAIAKKQIEELKNG